MTISEIINAYLKGLESGSYQQIIQLFDEAAIIHSPLYGKIQALTFYKELFSVTNNSRIHLKNIFLNSNDPYSAIAHFSYDWTFANGTITNFDCIDIFEFSKDMKIVKLTIIYDTYRVRGAFEAVASGK